MAKAFVPGMIKKCSGHVVTISSLAGLHGVSGLVDYCASKFGAIGFNEALRAEFDLQGYKDLHVTTVCPFYMDTGMFRGVIS
jgi:all-trans-retinol dehydrogenase (NAD+)